MARHEILENNYQVAVPGTQVSSAMRVFNFTEENFAEDSISMQKSSLLATNASGVKIGKNTCHATNLKIVS